MSAVRPGDRATLTILAFQDELTALGLLPAKPGAPVRSISDPSDGYGRNACGTVAAYYRHLREGTPTCGPCKQANSAYRAELRERRADRTRRAA